MNIAILIGISNYKSEAPLPACKLDAENMKRLLVATNKYDEIQLVVDTTSASQVKDALRQFFGKYQSVNGIEEAFVYFSGHGVYQNDAVFCCSDFDVNRPATTSISNAELDDLLIESYINHDNRRHISALYPYRQFDKGNGSWGFV